MKRLTVGMSTLAVTVLAVQATALSQENSDSPEYTVHPGAVALSESKPGQWSYKAFPSLRPLYINENDGSVPGAEDS